MDRILPVPVKPTFDRPKGIAAMIPGVSRSILPIALNLQPHYRLPKWAILEAPVK